MFLFFFIDSLQQERMILFQMKITSQSNVGMLERRLKEFSNILTSQEQRVNDQDNALSKNYVPSSEVMGRIRDLYSGLTDMWSKQRHKVDVYAKSLQFEFIYKEVCFLSFFLFF